MKIVVCPDSFKGTVSSARAASIIRSAALSVFPEAEVVTVPLADGGEGTCDALGAEKVPARVTGPDGIEVDSFFGVIGDIAVIELAAVAGLTLTSLHDPSLTTSRGAGELFISAADAGYKRFVLALGGSAVNDCGCGMASACGVVFYDSDGRQFVPVGGTLSKVSRIDASAIDPRIADAEITVMCDVDNPLYGERGAAFVFAPQKGADAETVARLDDGLRSIAEVIERDVGVTVSDIPGGGAAGGCGAGAVAFFGAEMRRGIDAVLDALDFDSILDGADLAVTGEGRFDRQSADGKVVSGVASRASSRRIPVAVVCGTAEKGADVLIPGISGVFPTVHGPVPDIITPADAEAALYKTSCEMIKLTLL
ncbi:MAG: glycerate kinase [Clostridia bacterium]|nr:glycerate kinase [Clostridia bacterium]